MNAFWLWMIVLVIFAVFYGNGAKTGATLLAAIVGFGFVVWLAYLGWWQLFP